MSQWNFPPKGGYMEAPKKMYFQTMTKLDVAERLKKDDVIIIPVGSTENHGAAGPIGEDTFMVTRIAEMVAEKTGCTVAEPVWYGSHPFHHIASPARSPCPTAFLSTFCGRSSPDSGTPASASRSSSACTDRSIPCRWPSRSGARSTRSRRCCILLTFPVSWDRL